MDRHWVGDGFPVRTLFAYPNLGPVISPFLLLDYAGPTEFPPTTTRRGVGEHPHRGFETVTIVYEGEVEHRDSSGGGGRIGPGDVQWMTAASGIVHEEFHGREFARRGGLFEMVQLWVNLPAKDKMAPPRLPGHPRREIPTVALPERPRNGARDRGRVRRREGAGARPSRRSTCGTCASTSDQRIDLALPDGYTTALVVLRGRAARERLRADRRGGGRRSSTARATSICIDGARRRDGAAALRRADRRADRRERAVRDEHRQEIRQAIADYQSGKMGHLY